MYTQDSPNSPLPPTAPRSKRHQSLTTWALVVTAVLIVAGMATILPMMISGISHEAIIKVPRNATLAQVEDTLKKYGGDKFSSNVMRLLRVSHFNPAQRHGAYILPKGMTPFQAARRISRGPQDPVTMTINGFRSLDYLAELLSRKYDFSKEEFLKAATDSAFLAQYGLTPKTALCLFLEDSYETYWSATPKQLLEKVGTNYKTFWTTDRKDMARMMGVSPEEFMILASIVDDETNYRQEKGTIARLYLNRLDQGMRLQADPTVKFALQDFGLKRITSQHTAFDSPYNTYRYAGLPPGPLRTTSRKTLSTMLDSEPNDYIYMCAKEDFSGTHVFAITYEEHLENARRYQRQLDARNIR